MKPGKLTKKARMEIREAVNRMIASRDLWTDAASLKLPEFVVAQRKGDFESARERLNELLDKHTEE